MFGMHLTRKVASISTGGLVDYRTSKQRTAANMRKVAKAAKRTNLLLAQQNALIRAQGSATATAGWYPNPDPAATNPATAYRYWNGVQWTPHFSPDIP